MGYFELNVSRWYRIKVRVMTADDCPPSILPFTQGCSELVQNQVPCYIHDRIRLASLVRQNWVPKFVET